MKKIFSLVAMAAMVSFVACTSNETEIEGDDMDTTVTTEVIAEPTPEPVAVDTITVDTTTAPASANVEAAH